MNVHYVQTTPFEVPASIADWARERGHDLAGTHLYDDDPLPAVADIDLLVVMGGPMSVHDEAEYPWLVDLKGLVERAVEREMPVLGVCLGAQLVAEVLGGTVTAHEHVEAGWFPVTATEAGRASPLLADLPDEFTVFHWHGDTFSIPPEATHLYRSEACENQAFVFDDRVVGLQFHPEVTPQSVANQVEAYPLADAGPWVQSVDELVDESQPFEAIRDYTYRLMDALADRA